MSAGFSVVTAVQSARVARERDKAQEVSAFLVELLRAPDPYRGQGREVTVRELLDSAEGRINRELAARPELQAQLFSVIGRSYWGLGMYPRARTALDSAIALRQRSGGDDFDLAQDETLAGSVALERDDYAAAESLSRAGLARAHRLFGDRHPNLTSGLLGLSRVLWAMNRAEEADSLLREAVAIQRAHRGDSLKSFADAVSVLAGRSWSKGNLAAADSAFREALTAYREVLGDSHPQVGWAYLDLGQVLGQRADRSGEWFLRRGLEIQRRALGDEHPDVVSATASLARLLMWRGDLVGADSVVQAALGTARRALPLERNIHLFAAAGEIALSRGHLRRADSLLQHALTLYERHGPPGGRSYVAGTLHLLGTAKMRQRRYPEAEPLLLESLALRRERWGDRHQRTLDSVRELAALYNAWGKPEKAREYRERLARIGDPD